MQDQLVTALLLHQPHSLSTAALATAQPEQRQQRRAEEWMREHLDEPLTLARIASACEVSTRSLQASFQRTRGMGPMQWLRRERLASTRAAPLAMTVAKPSIAQTAMQFGFTHLGEFSRAYRRAFGESPSQTLWRRT